MRHWLLVLVIVGASGAFAQSAEGSLRGTVRDLQGALISRATVTANAVGVNFSRSTLTNRSGEFQIPALPPGDYHVIIDSPGFSRYEADIKVSVGGSPTMEAVLKPATVRTSISVTGVPQSISDQPIETTSTTLSGSIGREDLEDIPLAHRSFANIAYIAPMTAPVEPSDPTKARITAVSFGGSSGLNVDLSVDGGDNNDDYIGGFLQNYSPDAIQEFNVRTALFDADTSRTNGGSVIISTRRGTDLWHGDVAGYFRDTNLEARNSLDNPAPNPKQPFDRQNIIGAIGGPILKQKLWFFASHEFVHEDASIPYSQLSLREFTALSKLASSNYLLGLPHGGITKIDVPLSTPVPFQDNIFDARFDWRQSDRTVWFLRGSFDRNRTKNDLVQQGTLPSTGSTTDSNYTSVLLSNQHALSPTWIGSLIVQGSWFDHFKLRNSHLGFALAFPFSANFHTTSGFETFGDNQFATEITAFPVERDQQKYQYRYDLSHVASTHTVKFGVNFIHEPVLRGAISGTDEILFRFPADPTFYVSNPPQFLADLKDPANRTVIPGSNGAFSQSIKRLGLYAQDTWRVTPDLTLNYGLRYDTTFGLFIASGRDQNSNPAVQTVRADGIPLPTGVPHDYRGGVAPRFGIAYSPHASGKTVFRAGVGMYYNDLTQNGWVDAFRAVNEPFTGTLLAPGDQGALIDPNYHTPYTIQLMAGIEHEFRPDWFVATQFVHQQGVHEYRRYEYVGGVTLFDAMGNPAPNLSVFRSDNRSRYDGASIIVRHRLTHDLEFTAHYTLARATTWGAVVGELFDYVNGVTDVRNPFGPGDHGPSGEDIRHRFVVAGTGRLPLGVEISTLAQFESARPFTMAMSFDANNDGLDSNDRAIINGVPTGLDQFRGVPLAQVDLRVAREWRIRERGSLRPFIEFFNLFNRQNPGNNFVGDLGVLAPPGEVAAGNVTHVCLVADCSQVAPITNLNQVKLPGGALGDFFGPGTTVGIPFAAQFGVRFSF